MKYRGEIILSFGEGTQANVEINGSVSISEVVDLMGRTIGIMLQSQGGLTMNNIKVLTKQFENAVYAEGKNYENQS